MIKQRKVIVRYLLVFGLFLISFVLGGTRAQAADNSLVYTGSQPNTNIPTYNHVSHEFYFSVTGKDGKTVRSNYATMPGSTDRNGSVVDSSNFQGLVEHFKVTNTSNKTYTVNEIITLPRYYVKTSNVVYAGSEAPKIETDYRDSTQPASKMDIQYMYLNGNTSDLQDLNEYRVIGTLAPGDSVEVNTPLKVLPRSNNSIDNIQVGNFSYGIPWNSDYDGATELGLNLRFGKYVSPLDYWDTNNKNVFIAATNNDQGSAVLAKDVQDLMPPISSNLDAFTYQNLNGESLPVGSPVYTGSSVTIHLTKLKGLDGQTSLADELHDEGYAFNILDNGTEQPTYTFTMGTGGVIYGDNNGSSIVMNETKYNGRTLGDAYLAIHKLISAKDETYPVSSKATWDQGAYQDVQFYDKNGQAITKPANASYTVQKVAANGTATKVANNEVDLTKDGVYQVTYVYPVTNSVTVKKTITVTVGKGNPTPTPVVPDNDQHPAATPTGSITSTTPKTSASNNGDLTSHSTTSKSAVPSNAAKKGTAVYATKKIYLYRQATFKKSQRIAVYPKAKRINRPMFVVTNNAYSKAGRLRYQVRDVNHHSKTAGKTGYITADRAFVVPVYYASMPKDKQVTVIAKNGANAYRNVNLTKKVKHYKKGAHLKVKKIVKHNLTSRYVLSNGDYLTGNKKLVIQGTN
ncbi:hypothetical protein YK48G_10080 [Lentilactobacillus fungorum]|uniref:DUF5776 domain-containing protein n=1 Tax=Lentilactobacillus fungorum TaxID=2201250 RepID=A0ABQ3VYW2_9LACO|nr:DUF5776 domain-containing protein [Lentilactobacillus fungorum]GHP13583.1 hypothetical protein YK48G_10080 [Lentilactobacillus fungorum]